MKCFGRKFKTSKQENQDSTKSMTTHPSQKLLSKRQKENIYH